MCDKNHEEQTQGICPVCNNIFNHEKRTHGGKKRTYCSDKCSRLDWIRRNPEKRKAILAKYDSNPENKIKKSEQNRLYRLRKKYGLTDEKFKIQLHRQNYCCYGCLKRLNKKNARVDHCHATGRFRGLLCDNCNWVLGNVKDDPAVLRRLMAYLDYKRETLSIYLIGALKNELRIPEIGNILRGEGYDVMDEWITPGEHADENWQRYEKIRGRNYKQALYGRAATNIFLFDKSYIDIFDAAVCIMPAGKSAFIELGYAKGRGKKTFILLDGKDPERYDIMPNIADRICFDIEELKEELNKIRCIAPPVVKETEEHISNRNGKLRCFSEIESANE